MGRMIYATFAWWQDKEGGPTYSQFQSFLIIAIRPASTKEAAARLTRGRKPRVPYGEVESKSTTLLRLTRPVVRKIMPLIARLR